VAVGIFSDGTYGAGWNNVGAASYLGKAGQGVTGLLHGDTSQFLMQIGGATLCAIYAFGFTFIVFKTINAFYPIRVSAEAEVEGLDVPQFGMLAYPESGDELSAAV
jgi:Amt family ammonium transporter